jgi:hypothetical protein
MRRWTLAGLGLASLLFLPQAVVAAPKMELAVADEGVQYLAPTDPKRLAAFARAKELGVTHWRVAMVWLRNADGSTHLDFAAKDAFVDDLRANGFTVQMTITGAIADWATFDAARGPSGIVLDSADVDEFTRFVRAVVQHYKGRVRRYSIWNEPNLAGFLLAGPTRADVEQYLRLKKTDRRAAGRLFKKKILPANARRFREIHEKGYAAVKAADPSAQVLFGELCPHNGFSFTRLVARRGTKLRADGFALHPYQFDVKPESSRGVKTSYMGIGRLRQVRNLLVHLARQRRLATPAGRALPIYATEFGYRKAEMSESRRALWLPRAYEVARKAGVRQMCHYLVVPGFDDMSLLDERSEPTPTFDALVRWSRARG